MAATPQDRKVVRTETFSLTDNDKFLLLQLSAAVSLAQQQFEQAQSNITNLLGIYSIERWGFPQDSDVRFSGFDLENGKVTVEELEKANDPKDNGAEANSSANTETTNESSVEEASETNASEEVDGTEEDTATKSKSEIRREAVQNGEEIPTV